VKLPTLASRALRISEEATAFLEGHPVDGAVLAGRQRLLPLVALRVAPPTLDEKLAVLG
jgi:CO/xanthine dehydrogenase FAD-binding subunit